MENHGEIFVSQSIVEKYNLGESVVDPIEEWFEDEEEIAEDWKDRLSGFSHYIITTCSLGFTTTRVRSTDLAYSQALFSASVFAYEYGCFDA